MSKSINCPWELKGILNELAGNSNTNLRSIIEFKGNHYFIYHIGVFIHTAAVSVDLVLSILFFITKMAPLKKIIMITRGIDPVK